MTEVILRQHKRQRDRWLPGKKRGFPWGKAVAAGRYILRCSPGFLLSFAEILGIPSGFHVAYGMGMAAAGRDVRPTLVGCAAAMMIRLLSGLSPRWEGLIAMALMAVASLLLAGRSSLLLMGMTAAAMLPTVIAASFAQTAAEILQGYAALPLAVLSAPVMARAILCLASDRHLSALEERVAAGYLAAMCLCGGARLLLLGFNIGVFLSAGIALAVALTLGVGPGTVAGMLAGVMLALQGVPLAISVALSMGGFMAGMANSMSRRRLSCGAFAMGAYLPLLLYGASGRGYGAAVLGASILMGVLPRALYERGQQFIRRFLPNDPVSGDAYAAAALAAWEQTVAAMARAVPAPHDGMVHRDGGWWQQHLCQGCPEYEECGCMTTELAVTKAENVWEYRYADEQIWRGALENLRGMGCQRLYYLLDAMCSLRQEDEASRRVIQQAEAQRDMLVTHLTAMSGAARKFSQLSSGDSWWDNMSAMRIRQELAERAIPAVLSYIRRVQGHIQAAFVLQFITGARKQAEELCVLVSSILEAPMQLSSLDGDRLLLKEIPLLRAEVGVASAAIVDGESCGDTAWTGILQDGRYLAALSDGMGHGENAALSSRQTVELLRLCLDAGYTRQQTLTAVNGMMLLGGGGERFATADVLIVDLWKGHAALDKLGAAASWVSQQGQLTRITGDALPLGIIEDVDQNGSNLVLAAGDTVVLLSDGVEDAFRSVKDLEAAVVLALAEESPDAVADKLLALSCEADEGKRRDDQSVVVVRISLTKDR